MGDLHRSKGIIESTFEILGLCCNVFDMKLIYAHSMCDGNGVSLSPQVTFSEFLYGNEVGFFFFFKIRNLVEIVQ